MIIRKFKAPFDLYGGAILKGTIYDCESSETICFPSIQRPLYGVVKEVVMSWEEVFESNITKNEYENFKRNYKRGDKVLVFEKATKKLSPRRNLDILDDFVGYVLVVNNDLEENGVLFYNVPFLFPHCVLCPAGDNVLPNVPKNKISQINSNNIILCKNKKEYDIICELFFKHNPNQSYNTYYKNDNYYVYYTSYINVDGIINEINNKNDEFILNAIDFIYESKK